MTTAQKNMTGMAQLDMFAQITEIYAEAGSPLRNDDLYQALAKRGSIDGDTLAQRTPIGESGELHSPVKRRIRWYQQTMRKMGLIRRVEGERGIWALTESVGAKLHRSLPGVRMMGFSTALGVAIWGSADEVFTDEGDKIDLICSSPPYPLQNPRAYGNPDEHAYTDFICRQMGGAIRALAPGACVALNLGQDVFEKGLPTRSLYLERLVIALCDRYFA